MAITLYFKWDTVDLAKAVYILFAYSMFGLGLQTLLWVIADRLYPRTKFKTNAFKTLFPESVSPQIIICLFFCALVVLQYFAEALSNQTEGLVIANTRRDFMWLWNLTFEKWWLALFAIGASMWKFAMDLRIVLRRDNEAQKMLERNHVRFGASILGCVVLTMVISAFATAETQTHLYALLIILFFLPWDTIFEILMKIYTDYWKLD